MENTWYEDDSVQELEPETVAIALLDLTQYVIGDDEALALMLEVVAIAMEWRQEVTGSWN